MGWKEMREWCGWLTSGSRFLTDCFRTSLVFLVQCGLQGNSLIRVVASLWSLFQKEC